MFILPSKRPTRRDDSGANRRALNISDVVLYSCATLLRRSLTDVVNLDSRDPRPLYLQIMDEVRRALVAGTLRPEDPMPSVRELSAQLVVNPRTVSQAYQELEREGVLYVRRG